MLHARSVKAEKRQVLLNQGWRALEAELKNLHKFAFLWQIPFTNQR